MAQQTKLNPETQAKIISAIRAGSYVETAASFAGVGKTTLYDWLRKGAVEKEGPFREFSQAVEHALASADVRDITVIATAAQKGVWQAAAWRLERKHPEQWGRRSVIQIGSSDGMLKTQEIELANLTDRELADLERLLNKGSISEDRTTEEEKT